MEMKMVPILRRVVMTLLVASLAAPMFIHSSFLFPFITPKTLYFRLIIEVAFFFYLVLCIVAPAFRPDMRNWVTWSLAAYIGIETIASVFGVQFGKSFWGTIERGEGLVLLYHLFAFYLMLSTVFRSKQEWSRLLHIHTWLVWFFSLYAWAQFFGIQVLGNEESRFSLQIVHSGAHRVSGTIGNPAFFAAYVLFSIFSALCLIVLSKRLWVKIVYSVVLVSQFFILYQTETRGSFLALIGGIFLLGILLTFGRGPRVLKQVFIGASAAILMLFSFLFVFRNSTFVLQQGTLHRIVSISKNDITTESRLLAWKASWDSFLSRPLLGYGYEHYAIAYNYHFPARIFKDAGSQLWFDRAHNTIFDVLITGGIFALIVYGCIFLSAWFLLYRTFRARENGSEPILLFILGTILAAHFFQNIFVFDILATYIWFYFILAYIVFVARDASGKSEQDYRIYALSLERQGGILVLVCVLFLVVYQVSVRPGIAAKRIIDGMADQRIGDQKKDASLIIRGMNTIKEAIDMGTNYTPEFRQRFAEIAIQELGNSVVAETDRKRFLDLAISEIKKNVALYPEDVQNYMYLMSLYNVYDSFDPAVLETLLSDAVAGRAKELSPTRPQIYFEEGQALITLGTAYRNSADQSRANGDGTAADAAMAKSNAYFTRGVAAFQTAVDLNPDTLDSQWNLAASLVIAGRSMESEKVFAHMAERNFDMHSQATLRRLVPIYAQGNDFVKLRAVYVELLEKYEPENAQYIWQIGLIDQVLGNTESARGMIEKAVALDSRYAEHAAIVLDQLDQGDGGRK